MVFFPDNRDKFSNSGQWEIDPASAHVDNKTKIESKTDRAARSQRGAFRLKTTEDLQLLQEMAEKEALTKKSAEPITINPEAQMAEQLPQDIKETIDSETDIL